MTDRVRQWLNLVFALAQPATAAVAFGLGTGFDEATGSAAGPTLIEPAGFAFIVWSVIYAGTIAYAVHQALPAQRATPLFRRIGWATASALASVSGWLLAARFGLIWLTVGCIVWMLASLVVPFREFVRSAGRLTAVQRAVAVFPFSVFLGWVSVATFADTAAALKGSGLLDVGLTEEGWTVVMLATAGLIGAAVTYRSGGNVGYGLTLIWAMIGILAADRGRVPPTWISPVAVGVAVAVAVALVAGRLAAHRRPAPAHA